MLLYFPVVCGIMLLLPALVVRLLMLLMLLMLPPLPLFVLLSVQLCRLCCWEQAANSPTPLACTQILSRVYRKTKLHPSPISW